MKEILFKAKKIDNGEWEEGFYGIKGKGTDIEKHFIMKDNFHPYTSGYPFYFTDIEVDPETVCQYTGLKDKNGRKVFENDILRLEDKNNGYTWIGVVEFGNPNATYNWGFQLRKIAGEEVNTDILLWIECEETGAYAEVIGNVFDKKVNSNE